jgi:hypothetical protein
MEENFRVVPKNYATHFTTYDSFRSNISTFYLGLRYQQLPEITRTHTNTYRKQNFFHQTLECVQLGITILSKSTRKNTGSLK